MSDSKGPKGDYEVGYGKPPKLPQTRLSLMSCR